MNHYHNVIFSIFILSILLSFSFVSFSDAAEQWSQVIGGSEPEFSYSIIQTTDGGYAAVGFIYHSDGWCDLWLLKMDASGNKQWNQNLDNHAIESQFKVIQTRDGGYAIAGSSLAGYNDFKLIKTDSSGKIQWNKTYGGEGDEKAYSLVQTSDEGYAIAGSAWGPSSGTPYFWLVKVDSTGSEQWSQMYQYSGCESGANCLIVTKDGGYALAGYVVLADGREDFRLVKTDSAGKMLWSETYGTSDKDIAYSVVQTTDGGYALAGYTGIINWRGDFWLVKTDSAGKMLWNRQYGGSYEEFGAYSLVQLNDGGYALAGGLGLAEPSSGVRDFLLVRADSSGVQLWNRTYGGSSDDYVTSMVKTNDGAYVLIGSTNVNGVNKLLLLKTEILETNITPSPSATVNPSSNIQAPSNSPNTSTNPSPTVPELSTLVMLTILVLFTSVLSMLKWKRHEHLNFKVHKSAMKATKLRNEMVH